MKKPNIVHRTSNIEEQKHDNKTEYPSISATDVIAHQGILDKGVHFLQKPFLMHDMASKIQEAIGKT